ncbi:hypothetical protein [Fusibacter sp. JL216-2]|uniref:hypothetical protein n=1 Tax=Fusibacter sp. JL216-2 TaxID=3071453 RepID=UPI003D3530E1
MSNEELKEYLKQSISAITLAIVIITFIGFTYQLGRFIAVVGGNAVISFSSIIILPVREYVVSGLTFLHIYLFPFFLTCILIIYFNNVKSDFIIKYSKIVNWILILLFTSIFLLYLNSFPLNTEGKCSIFRLVMFSTLSMTVMFAFKTNHDSAKRLSIVFVLGFILAAPFTEGKTDVIEVTSAFESNDENLSIVQINTDEKRYYLFNDLEDYVVVYDFEYKRLSKIDKDQITKVDYSHSLRTIPDDWDDIKLNKDDYNLIDSFYDNMYNSSDLSVQNLKNNILADHLFNSLFMYRDEEEISKILLREERQIKFQDFSGYKEIGKINIDGFDYIYLIEHWGTINKFKRFRVMSNKILSIEEATELDISILTRGYEDI